MKKLSIFLLLQLSPKQSYQRPSMDENIEGMLDITKDRVNIDEGVSYPQGINSTQLKTASVLDNFSTRFAKRPTPKPVAEPISATNSDKPATDPRDIDSILGLLRDNIALPLPQNVRMIETTLRFPFLDWQDKESVSNTQRFKDDNLINTNLNLPIEDNLDRFSRPSKESFDGPNLTNSKETSSDSGSFKQERSFGQIKGHDHGGHVSEFPYALLENNDKENTHTSELRISINKEDDELLPTERINESSKKQGSGLFKQESRFDHVEGKFGQGDLQAVSGRTKESRIQNKIVEEYIESIFEDDGSGAGINKDNELTDATNANDDLEKNAKMDKLNERQPKSSESENNKEENSQHDESLGKVENTLNHILTRKLKIESSDDNLEYIFEGNSDASNEIEDDKYEIEEPIKTANVKDDKGLCGHLQTESERVRCKVIACFGDNETCYNK